MAETQDNSWYLLGIAKATGAVIDAARVVVESRDKHSALFWETVNDLEDKLNQLEKALG